MAVVRWQQLIPYCLAFIAGGLSNLSFAPLNVYFINFITLAMLLTLILRQTRQLSACFIGFCFGLGLFGVGVSWVFVSMHRYGDMGVLLAALVTALFLITLSLSTAATAWLTRRWSPTNFNIQHLCALFPALWVVFEWLRSWVLTGFPWLYLGDTLVNTPLAGWLPIFGVYGGSLLVSMIAGGFYGLMGFHSNTRRWGCLIIIVVIMLSGQLLRMVPWSHPTPHKTTISLVQGNIAPANKWQPQQLQSIAQHYQKMTAKHWSSDLIIWPENALPIPKQWAEPFLNDLTHKAQQQHSTVYVGLPMATPYNNTYFNSIYAIGTESGIYHKRHLVPFGEYVPFYDWLNSWFHFPFAQFYPGSNYQDLLTFNGIKIAPFICYEIAYPQLVNRTSRSANLLLVTSDDGWFGRSFATWQHIQIAQTQALINQKPLLFVTNNGLTTLISKNGQIIEHLPQNEAGVLTKTITTYSGQTLWNIWGNWPLVLLLLIGLIIWQQKVILRALRELKTLVRL